MADEKAVAPEPAARPAGLLLKVAAQVEVDPAAAGSAPAMAEAAPVAPVWVAAPVAATGRGEARKAPAIAVPAPAPGRAPVAAADAKDLNGPAKASPVVAEAGRRVAGAVRPATGVTVLVAAAVPVAVLPGPLPVVVAPVARVNHAGPARAAPASFIATGLVARVMATVAVVARAPKGAAGGRAVRVP